MCASFNVGSCTKHACHVIIFCRFNETQLKKLYANVFEGKQSENRISSLLKWECLVQAATNRSSTDRELDISMKVAACVLRAATCLVLAHGASQGFKGKIQNVEGSMVRTQDQRGVVHEVLDNLRALFNFKSSSPIENDTNSTAAGGSADSPPVHDHFSQVMPLQPSLLFKYRNQHRCPGINAENTRI
jgi:hypothetical protein